MISKVFRVNCPNCEKEILFKGKVKTIIKCSKCSHFVLLIRGENLPEVYDYLTPEENAFFSQHIIYIGIYPILVGKFKFDESALKLFMKKSKRAGGALVKYLNNAKKDLLTPLEKNILYKLKAEDINDIEELIEEKRKYLKAKIECVKLLRILDF